MARFLLAVLALFLAPAAALVVAPTARPAAAVTARATSPQMRDVVRVQIDIEQGEPCAAAHPPVERGDSEGAHREGRRLCWTEPSQSAPVVASSPPLAPGGH